MSGAGKVPDTFRLLAGDAAGSRHALTVHGILSEADKLAPLAAALVNEDGFDAVWAYDSWAYWGALNQASRIGASDLLDAVTGVRGLLRGASMLVARKATGVLETPSYVIEGAADEIHGLLSLLGWRDVALIGHSLGGLVVRAVAECHDCRELVGSVQTLATPHRLWALAHRPRRWEMHPAPTIPYLAMLGTNDWVCTHRSWANLTADDADCSSLCKLLIPEAGHKSIHVPDGSSRVPMLVSRFHARHGFRRILDAYVTERDGTRYFHMGRRGVRPPRGARSLRATMGEWLVYDAGGDAGATGGAATSSK